MKQSSIATCLTVLLFGSAVAAGASGDEPTVAQVEALVTDSVRNAAVWRALQKRDLEVIELAAPLAEQGSPMAQYALGEMRMVGTELDGDPAVAIEWFERAAAAWYPPALYRLALIYSSGYGGQHDRAQSRELYGRWAQANAAIAGHYADKTKPILFIHRNGEGPVHRFWKERQGYYLALGRRITTSATRAAPTDETHPFSLTKMPSACRPSTIPAREMMAAKIDSFAGSLILLSDREGRIEGMLIQSTAGLPLQIAALELLQKGLRGPECVVKWPGDERPVEIPFVFRFMD